MRKRFARILFLAMLAIGSMAGAKISQEEIEQLLNLMHRTEIVQVIKKDEL